MQGLPLGINTLDAIRSNNMVYIDKTAIAWNLIKQPSRFFLSRPRRFGKSLFLDTLKEIFQGNQALFEGLYIQDKWDWSVAYPVIKIDFAGGMLQSRAQLDESIQEILAALQQHFGIACQNRSIQGKFSELIRKVKEKHGRNVVVLVDEYDKPILDNIDTPEIAAQMREGLKNFYSVLKEMDAHLQFVFMTGVSKLSKVSLFSGLNQLKDITLSRDYATICGYTHEDLRRSFAEHLEGVDWDKLKRWYDGYTWLGEAVYNPYDILLFISEKKTYRNYWFETGTPSFLIRLFQKNQYFLPDVENIEVGEEVLNSFDVERINPVTLLFQTGYLTITSVNDEWGEILFTLRTPNMEVRQALNTAFINGYAGLDNEQYGFKKGLVMSLRHADFAKMEGVIQRLFAAIPYRNFTNNTLPETEGYYASVLYAFFASLNAEIIPEDITNHGQVDLTVKLGPNIYVMEIKVINDTEIDHNPALEQIKDKGYAQKYLGTPEMQVHALGLVFSKATRNLVKFDWVVI